MTFRKIGRLGKVGDLDVPDIPEETDVGRRRGAAIDPPALFKRPPLPSVEQEPLERAAAGAPEILSQPEAIWFMALRTAGLEPHIRMIWRGGEEVVGGAVLDIVVFRWGRRFVFRIQSYWHDPNYFPDRAIMDDVQRRELELEGWEVRDVWEWEIQLAVYGGTLEQLVWSVMAGVRGA